jgi:hypothetical protein
VLASCILVTLSWGVTQVWLLNMYDYTATSYSTRLRATGTGLIDGLGHLGAILGPIVAGWLFTSTADTRPRRLVRLRDNPRRAYTRHHDCSLRDRPKARDP